MNKSLRPWIPKVIFLLLAISLFINFESIAQISISIPDTIPTCLGANFKINAVVNPATGNTYVWTGPNGYTSTEKDASIVNLTENGMGVYKVTVTDLGGGVGTAQAVVKANAIETALIGGFTNVCVGENLRLRDIIFRPDNEKPLSYFWTGPDGYTSTADRTNIPTTEDLRQAGEYSLTETYPNGCLVTAKLTPTINKCLSIGNLVWEDTNNDGLNNNGEKGIGKVSVRLFRAKLDETNPDNPLYFPDGLPIQTTKTDSLTGKYLFADLVPGFYIVEIDAPTDYASSVGTNDSPIGIYEPSPNANSDENDNDDGSTITGQIIRTTFIGLGNFVEPQNDGDLTSGTSADKNSNLTIDFGLVKVPECKKEVCLPYVAKKK
ncbi:MAG: SdrD B-like domain-containing protein [Arcicella sp.]|nr:SdrD B-like domain-containing protein [Arcicella sp.]